MSRCKEKINFGALTPFSEVEVDTLDLSSLDDYTYLNLGGQESTP